MQYSKLMSALSGTTSSSAIEEWLQDCRDSNEAKQSCLNLYVFVQSDCLHEDDMVLLFDRFGNHLSARRSEDPIVRPHGFAASIANDQARFFWNSAFCCFPRHVRLAHIKSLFHAQRVLESASSAPLEKIRKQPICSPEHVIKRLNNVLEGGGVRLSGSNSILWVTEKNGLDSALVEAHEGSFAENVRAKLGLAHLNGFAVEFSFEADSESAIFKPHTVHSDFYQYFIEADRVAEFGVTLDLLALRPSLPEMVMQPFKPKFLRARLLGECAPYVSPGESAWKRLFDWRKLEIRGKLDTDFIEDFDDFLEKICIGETDVSH